MKYIVVKLYEWKLKHLLSNQENLWIPVTSMIFMDDNDYLQIYICLEDRGGREWNNIWFVFYF